MCRTLGSAAERAGARTAGECAQAAEERQGAPSRQCQGTTPQMMVFGWCHLNPTTNPLWVPAKVLECFHLGWSLVRPQWPLTPLDPSETNGYSIKPTGG